MNSLKLTTRMIPNNPTTAATYELEIGRTEQKSFGYNKLDSLIEFMKEISDYLHKKAKDGLVLIIDEVDRITDLRNKQLFFKTFSEMMITARITNICVIIASVKQLDNEGIYFEGFYDSLELRRLDKETTELFIGSTMAKVNHTISQEVIDEIYNYSQGLPIKVQLISKYVYLADTDDHIDILDFQKGYQEYLNKIEKM